MTEESNKFERKNVIEFDQNSFSRLIISQMSNNREGRSILKGYKQSEVRDIVDGFSLERNQAKLRDISKLLFAKSPQYKRLIEYFAGMALFAHVVAPIKDIKKLNNTKVMKQYTQIGELLKLMSIRHEMTKVLKIAFREDIFYGYIHRDKNSFYVQHIDGSIAKITSIEDGVFNFSIDMSYFDRNPLLLSTYATEVQLKHKQWKQMKSINSTLSSWVELDAENTICIKINEEMLDVFPPFAGSFDAIFDIDGFKQLRKDKEELSNYMIITQELPMRANSDNNNDFMIDKDMMMFFHNMAGDTVPENVGVITSPMKINALKFDKDRADSDGVAKAERDLWSGLGVSQLLFNADKSTSQGLLMSVKTDEEIVFGVLTQIQRWLNRYLKFEFSELMFNVNILHVTYFNRQDMYKMYIESAQYGIPVKSMLSATIGLDPIEMMNMAYLENDLLKMHEEFIPLMSSHVMGADGVAGLTGGTSGGANGRPAKDVSKVSDETARAKDKPNA
jgi:hypothetical protein